ncbi:MAG: Metallo-dependent phosphatase-like protein [Benjaminiella poitrasii]|nr:MAG: Metallo-dependent phosphatase-like protein [Benjaminiella poitrasii]
MTVSITKSSTTEKDLFKDAIFEEPYCNKRHKKDIIAVLIIMASIVFSFFMSVFVTYLIHTEKQKIQKVITPTALQNMAVSIGKRTLSLEIDNDTNVLIASPNTLALDSTIDAVNNSLDHVLSYAHDVSPYARLTKLIVYNPPPETGRIFVMADVHGDLVFRGENSIGVIRRARELGALCVRGNHDDKVIRLKTYEYQHGLQAMVPEDQLMPEGNVGDPLKFGNKHFAISKNMTSEEYDYIVSCPLILEIPSMNAIVVHGGIDPAVTNLIDNDPWSVMNMRDMNERNQPTKKKLVRKDDNKRSSNIQHWSIAYESHIVHSTEEKRVVYYGHDASRGVTIGNYTIGLDSGCSYGRQLSIFEMKSKILTQVECSTKQGNTHGHDGSDDS